MPACVPLRAQRATHRSVNREFPVSHSGLSNSFHPSPVAHATGRKMPPSGLSWRVAYLTSCDVSGQARSSLRRALRQRPREQYGAEPRAQASQQVWRATSTKPQKAPAFKGLVPDERNRFGALTRIPLQDRVRGPLAHERGLGLVDQAISAPNLLRHFGTSPNVDG